MPHTLTVRPATLDDARDFAHIAVEALIDKYRPALGRAAVDASEAITAAGIRSCPGSRHMVADLDGRMAGVVHLALGPGPEQAPLTQALMDAVGWWRTMRAAFIFSLLGPHRVAADEAYVDEVAVAPWARRQGVARALLAACAEAARAAGKSRLTLMVTIDNAPARALYESVGFVETTRRRWYLTRWIFRAPGYLLMECPLPPE